MSRPFPSHVAVGQTMQFRIDQRRQALEGRLVPIAPIEEELCNFIW